MAEAASKTKCEVRQKQSAGDQFTVGNMFAPRRIQCRLHCFL